MGVKDTFIAKHKLHIYTEKAYIYAFSESGTLVA